MQIHLTDYTPIYACRDKTWSPAAKNIITFACSEFFRSLRTDNLRNKISININGIAHQTAREILDTAALVSSSGR